MGELEKVLRDLVKNFKQIQSDINTVFLLKQHTRTHYIAYVFIRLLEEELRVLNNEHLSSIVSNVVDYLFKNIKVFSDMIN